MLKRVDLTILQSYHLGIEIMQRLGPYLYQPALQSYHLGIEISLHF